MADDKKRDHLHVVADEEAARQEIADNIADAERVKPQTPVPVFPDYHGKKPQEIIYKSLAAGDWRWHLEPGEYLPRDCPVLPLGHNSGVYFFLNSAQEFVALQAREFSQKTINDLFGLTPEFMHWAWPRVNAGGVVVGWRQEKATEDLMKACQALGVIDPVETLRGRGAWTDEEGQLIVHCGMTLWQDGRVMKLGRIGKFVYPRRAPILSPWNESLAGKDGPFHMLWPLLKSFNWDRPDLDPFLLAGWIAAASIPGALPWRSVVFLTGGHGTGKTTVQRILKGLFGLSLVQSSNATAAGIYQLMRYDALPVAIDENEADPDNHRTKALLDLARSSTDDQVTLRGGDRHEPTRFFNHSNFIFSSINPPPRNSADASRMAFLQLNTIPEDQPEPQLDQVELIRAGRKILRRMIDNWNRFGNVLDAYMTMLRDCRLNGRSQRTFGTLMACADCAIDQDSLKLDIPIGQNCDDLRIWHRHFEKLREVEEIEDNWRRCLDRLLTAPVDLWRSGQRKTVASLLEGFMSNALSYEETRRQLADIGLSLRRPEPGEEPREVQLVIPAQHGALESLFRFTAWLMGPGQGGWMDALRQANVPYKIANMRIAGLQCRSICFGLSIVMRQAPDK